MAGVIQYCWEKIICSFFPARHTRNFPVSEIKLVGFPASCKVRNQHAKTLTISYIVSQNGRSKRPSIYQGLDGGGGGRGGGRYYSTGYSYLVEHGLINLVEWTRRGAVLVLL